MKISHHFDDATLISFSSGSLSAGMALLVASHIDICPDCAGRVAQVRAMGGAMLNDIEPVSVAQDSLSSVLALLDEPENAPQSMSQQLIQDQQIRDNANGLPRPLWLELGHDLEELNWRKIGVGVQQYDLKLEGPGSARLLRLQPGVSVPHHTHRGNELTLILKGSYSDELGRFAAGDVADVDTEVKHQPIVDTGEECICLIATDAPLKFTGLMGRLVQPFIGL